MKIKTLGYTENEKSPDVWVLNQFDVNDINLIVGKNSSGKTRVLNVISALSKCLSLQNVSYNSAHFDITFEEGENIYHYELLIKNKAVVKEELKINNVSCLIRNADGIGKMKNAMVEDRLLEFKIPVRQVAVNRYDEYQYPYLKPINEWANNVRHFNFNLDIGKNHFSLPGIVQENKEFDTKETNKVIELVMQAFKQFKNPFKKNVIKDFGVIGYRITDIELQPIKSIEINQGGKLIGIVVQESDRKGVTDQLSMSTGMFRALSIIIHIAFYELSKIPGTLLIDDIGEGLDHERATNLIKLLTEKALKNKIQLLMSTNDKFVMNNIALEYWQVLTRKGETVSAHNKTNSAKIFKEFEFTGLNNFDFFSTDFYKEGFIEEEEDAQ